jgi:hypothetical protein
VRRDRWHSGKARTAIPGGNVAQRPFTGRLTQRWDMFSVGSVGGSKVAFRYRNKSTGTCLDLSNESGGSGTPLKLLPCNAAKRSQHWVRDFSINSAFLQTVNRASGLAMTVRNRSVSNFATIDQSFPGNLPHQRWSVFGFGA